MVEWTPDQKATLTKFGGKVSVKHIMAMTGLSESAIRSKAWRDDINLSVRRETPRGKRILKPRRAA